MKINFSPFFFPPLQAAEQGRPPEHTSKFYAKGALQYLVPILTQTLTKQVSATFPDGIAAQELFLPPLAPLGIGFWLPLIPKSPQEVAVPGL